MSACASCGSEVSESSNFCTSCGQPMAKTQPPAIAASNVPACPSCGKAIEGSFAFCTGCGQNLPAATEIGAGAEPAAVAKPVVAPAPQTAPAGEAAPQPPASEPASAGTQPSYPAPSAYPPSTYPQDAYSQNQQPSRGRFGLVVFILLIVIIGGALGGWYFWGVETVVVCSPPDVRVFLDDQEVTATSYGRYVIPHLSRKPHLLKVQKAGFADTIERLDFSLTSAHEWVNIRLVPSRQIRP